ncbi:M48 family metallopeptidase [Sphingomonas sp. SORGH_AS_0879]|uniref:M48 family metallopeptidase n=1 Tax=Sphingomonas sp. SORGH_AS_0879 TaxID=3041790 RepID=UPI0027806D1D|nr:SprT family zinc-dependent metalloprotease [Sphingomonas sp. SORGH_AS_0879]MDQ1228801.1 putative metal-dependent hydrolase [Sphingomonas sp. SORGH_AS_0879]
MIDEVVRHPTAKTIRLSVDPATGTARLIVPRCAGLKSALAWAEEKKDWIAEQRARLPNPRPFVPGATIPFGDVTLTLEWREGRARVIQREGNRLCASGPIETLGRRVEAWLKRQALEVLARETAEVARAAGVTVTKVSVADPKARWGSCASTGAIRYSWRLILAPDFVRRATVAHEVAHRVHMNHAPVFHALVAELLGEDPTPATAWLRRHGAGLHWYGRSS